MLGQVKFKIPAGAEWEDYNGPVAHKGEWVHARVTGLTRSGELEPTALSLSPFPSLFPAMASAEGVVLILLPQGKGELKVPLNPGGGHFVRLPVIDVEADLLFLDVSTKTSGGQDSGFWYLRGD